MFKYGLNQNADRERKKVADRLERERIRKLMAEDEEGYRHT